ncbi:MAG: OmpA family protein [Ignavibacterium sp.]|nr:OmpA family protein [Ignavibacterium sp.]
MKLYIIIISFALVLGCTYEAFAQFDLGKKLKKKVERRVEKGVDKAIDKTLDATEDAVENAGTEDQNNKKENKESRSNNSSAATNSETNETESSAQDHIPDEKLKMWSKYDFVAGEKVIFNDDLTGEQQGEFPSRWDLTSGNAEIANLGNEKVIYFANNKTTILPLMDKKNFLPDVFTIEFDIYLDELATQRSNQYILRFFEGPGGWANMNGIRRHSIVISWNEVSMDKLGSKTADFNDEKKSWKGKWKRVAVSFNKRSLKVYLDEERMLNVPNLGYKPEMFSLGCNYDDRYIKTSSIKNIRVNEGGNKLYDRVMADGKFVTTGILFDVNKSTIKGESMGTINEIVKMMKEHSDLKFSIEGHTDSDGDNGFNQKLSEERAASVKNTLVQSGIDASRLSTKGLGENKPVDSNSTPEGKANNRRVEFIKI